MLKRLEAMVETRTARVFLVVLIVLSVLPYAEIERLFWPLFLVVFGTDLAIRVALMVDDPRNRKLFDYALVTVDALAFVSFLPLETLLGELATPLRLARLLLLVRFVRALAEDVYSVLTRREQVQQFVLVTLAVVGMAFASAVALSLLEVLEESEANLAKGSTFWDRLWWSFRQIESPDNLVQTLRVHPFVAVVSLTLTITGVFIVSFIIGLGANIVGHVLRAERRRPVAYRGHAVVIGPVVDRSELVAEFVRIYEKNSQLRRIRPREVYDWFFKGAPTPKRHALPRIALLGPTAEAPDYLLEREMRWVVYRQGEPANAEALDLIAATHAKRAILLGTPAGLDTDAVTIASLAAFRERNTDAHVFVELHESINAPLAITVGGRGTFPLDVPAFIGNFLLQYLVSPGIEGVFADLLTARGSEFYTHVFVDKRELAMVEALAKREPTLSFSDLWHSARRDGILVVGVLVGKGEFGRTPYELIPIDRLEQRINPAAREDREARAIRTRELRGLIAISPSYLPLRRYARRLLAERPARAPSEKRTPVLGHLSVDHRPVERVLVVGYSPALGALVRGLARLVHGVDVVVVISAREDAKTSLRERLKALDLGLEHAAPGSEGARVDLANGGHAVVFTHEGSDLTQFAVEHLKAPVDAAVFLADPDSLDPDARTLLRVLRFARALEDGHAPRGDRLHLLVEFASEQRGVRLEVELERGRCGFSEPDALRLTRLSTDRLKNYFMVHSAFVPGVMALYEEILATTGQTIVRLDLAPLDTGTVTLESVADELTESGCIPIAFELRDGEVALNPPHGAKWPASEVRAVFAIGDAARVRRSFRNRTSRS
jgi:hypothetical protein